MSKNNISMPQTTAGITRFSDQDSSKIRFRPIVVVVTVVVVLLIVWCLHLFGNAIFGI